MARKGFTPNGREKLLVALQLSDIVNEINTALRVRKAQLTLNYMGLQPQLTVSMPGTKEQTWLVCDPRSKRCFGFWPANPDLNALVNDIIHRLHKYGAWLAIGVEKKPNEKARAKLQVFLHDSRSTAITLVSTRKEQVQARSEYLLPKVLT